MPEEEATFPGEWPGIYACDARNLLDVYVLTARARLAALDGDTRDAQVSDSATTPELLWSMSVCWQSLPVHRSPSNAPARRAAARVCL